MPIVDIQIHLSDNAILPTATPIYINPSNPKIAARSRDLTPSKSCHKGR